MIVLAFGVAQIGASGYALWRGGAPERWVAVMLLVAALANWIVPAGATSFQQVFWEILWIDLTLLVCLSFISALADRFWPMWMAGCQFLAMAGHGVRAYDPDLVSAAYWLVVSSLAYPMLALLVIGSWRHRRRVSSASEYAWTFQRHRRERDARSAAAR